MVKEDDVHDGFVKGSKGVDQYFIHEPEDHGLQSVDEWSSVQDSAPRAVNKGTTDFSPWGSIAKPLDMEEVLKLVHASIGKP